MSFKRGRVRPTADLGRKAHFSDYVKAAQLPPPPTSVDNSPKAMNSLTNIYLNNRLGCCLVSAGYHCEGTWTGNAGNLYNASDADVIFYYGKIGGYDPNDPSTDQGCDEITAFDYWIANGFRDGVKPLGYLLVDATSQTHWWCRSGELNSRFSD